MEDQQMCDILQRYRQTSLQEQADQLVREAQSSQDDVSVLLIELS